MRKRLIIALAAMLLLAPWPVAYAYDNVKVGEAVRIEAAQASVAPAWKIYGGAVGGVTNTGDLFYIDASDQAADLRATLYLTNSDELIHYYRYLILRVGLYRQTDTGRWEKVVKGDGSSLPDTYITMQNGRVDLALSGYGKYKVTIDGGSYYAFSYVTGGGSASPRFYLTAE